MIVSIHIPKTAGTSWRAQLGWAFKSRLFNDYEDDTDFFALRTPEEEMARANRTAAMRARRNELLRNYDAIHGHFIADKYANLFPTTQFAAIFRDPYQQMVSLYHFVGHKIKELKQLYPTLPEFIEHFPNPQSAFLGTREVEDFTMVGLTEQYARSGALFETIFDRKFPHGVVLNTNPNRQSNAYEIDIATKKAVDRHCSADIELYRRAHEMFLRLSYHYDV